MRIRLEIEAPDSNDSEALVRALDEIADHLSAVGYTDAEWETTPVAANGIKYRYRVERRSADALR